jgi:hypothetical protein
MSKNVLEVNKPRIGWYFDGQPEEVSPMTATLLEDNGSRITLRIPIHPEQDIGPVARWFYGNGVHFEDDPDRTKYSYRPPEALLFQDPGGTVLLLGCGSLGIRSQLPGVSEGTLRARYAVIGAKTTLYSSPDQIRTYIPGMGSWSNISSITTKPTLDEEGKVRQLEVMAKSLDPIELAPGVILASSWSSGSRGRDNHMEMSDPPFIQTTYENPTEIREHLIAHTSFRELVDLAFWKPTGYMRIEFKLFSDSTHGRNEWRDVKTYSLRSQKDPHKGSPMFYFEDIKPEGYRLWCDLREKYKRAINPIMSLLDIQDSNVESQFVQSCIGLEGLGVQLGRDAGNNGRVTLEKSLSRIVKDIGFSFSSDWAKRIATMYNDVKHYDRDQAVVPLEIYNSLLENELVFRAWAGLRIGITKHKVIRGLEISSAAQQLLQLGVIVLPKV